MTNPPKITITESTAEEKYRIFSLDVVIGRNRRNFKLYVFNSELLLDEGELTQEKVNQFAIKQIESWLNDSGGKFPKDKYRVLINGGRVTTDNIESFLSVEKKTSDLVRTNVTISAQLFEWAKIKAQKEGTSFSDLVSRGLLTLKDSYHEVEAWYKEQSSYFKKKLGEFGSFEAFHYLPNVYGEFDTETLKAALQTAEQRRTGWPIGVYLTGGEQKPQPQADGIKAEYSDTPSLLLDYWYAKNKGEFYFARNLESDSGHGEAKPKTSLYFDTFVWRVAEALEHCLAYYEALNIDNQERVKIKLSLYGLNNRFLSAWNPGRAFTLRHYTCGSDSSSWELEITLQKLKQQLDEIIYDATKKLLVMFDFFVPNKGVIQDILNREYRKSNI